MAAIAIEARTRFGEPGSRGVICLFGGGIFHLGLHRLQQIDRQHFINLDS
jgi:hypothetical protein